MPTLKKFDKTSIERKVLPLQKTMCGKDQQVFWHPELHGFGLKVSARKVVYVVQKTIKTDRGEKTSRLILGGYREFKSVDEAYEVARDALGKMRKGLDLNAEKKAAKSSELSLKQVLDDYLRVYEKRLRPKTKQVYRSAVERCFQDWLSMPLANIDESMIATRQLDLSNANGPRGKGEAQANQAMRVLRTLFNFAMEAYKDARKKPVITSNPVRTLKARRLWNKVGSRDDVILDDQLPDWYQAVLKLDNSTIADFMLVCLFSGLRRGEAARLKWDAVRLTGPRPVLKIPAEDTKTNSAHELPLSDFLVNLLECRDKVRRIDSRYVFPGEKPGSFIVEPKRAIAKVIESSGVDFSMHTLRRTFGTIAGRLDIGHYKHKMLMNHSMKTEVTGAHYVKLTVEDLRQPMQKIADYLKQQIGIASCEAQVLETQTYPGV